MRTGAYRSLPIGLILAGACMGAAARSSADPAGEAAQFERLQNRLADIADEVRPGVVAIRADRRLDGPDGPAEGPAIPDDDGRRGSREQVFPSIGTGSVISPDGLILTNEHVVHNASPDSIECILFDGQIYKVQAMTTDPRSDLAVLRIEASHLKPVRLGDLSTVRQGHFAIVMGNPFGTASENSGRAAMSFGVVSAIGQDLTQKLDALQQRYYGNLIQTDARINPGNSGGPMLNLKGEVIGITTALSTRSGGNEGVGYAIPIDKRTKEIIAQLARGEEVEYGMLGVRLEAPTDVDRQLAGGPAKGGAVIRQVESNTPASAADLRPGDLVSEFDGNIINDVDQLVRLVGGARVGRGVTIVFYRQQHRMTVTVQPAKKDVLRGVNVEAPLEWRGMRLVNPTPDILQAFRLPESTEGVVVVQVENAGPGRKAGLRAGDVIRQVGDEPVHGVRRLRELATQLSGAVRITVADQTNPERTLP